MWKQTKTFIMYHNDLEYSNRQVWAITQTHKGAVWSASTLFAILSASCMVKTHSSNFMIITETCLGVPNVWLLRHTSSKPPYDKTNKMACMPSEDSNQPGHQPSLIRVLAVTMKKAWVLSYPLSAQWRLWSNWASAGRTVILLVLSWSGSIILKSVNKLLLALTKTRTKPITTCNGSYRRRK